MAAGRSARAAVGPAAGRACAQKARRSRFARVRHGAREALVEHAAERIHVGAPVELLPEICSGARRSRSSRGTARPAVEPPLPGRSLREPEVREVGALGVDHDVGRLHVPVHEAARRAPRRGPMPPVARTQSASEARGMPRRAEQRRQVGALDQLHGDVELAVRLARVVDRDDARVAQGAASRDSRTKRLRKSALSARAGVSSFRATRRSRWKWRAKYTTPIPPRPRNADPIAGQRAPDARVPHFVCFVPRLVR